MTPHPEPPPEVSDAIANLAAVLKDARNGKLAALGIDPAPALWPEEGTDREWRDFATALMLVVDLSPRGLLHHETCPHVRLGRLHKCRCEPVPMFAGGEPSLPPVDAEARPAKVKRCPSCGTRIFNEAADRGGCFGCFPKLPDDEGARLGDDVPR